MGFFLEFLAVGPKGEMFGGGIDTGSLCGIVSPPNGWDVDVRVTENSTSGSFVLNICPHCLVILRETRR